MQIGRVIGTVVATQKHHSLHGTKLMMVQPTSPSGDDRGLALLAVDGVGAGLGERVLVVLEGKSAGAVVGVTSATVDAAIVGIIDHLDVVEESS